MDIMDSNSSIFVQAKLEYTKQLINTLKPHIHYRECFNNGMLNPVKTIYLKKK